MNFNSTYLKTPSEILEGSEGYGEGWAHQWRWGWSLGGDQLGATREVLSKLSKLSW